MHKYLSIAVGLLLALDSYANSYVFGGRAHFNGSLVNPSCAFSQDGNLKRLVNTEVDAELKLNVSDCSSMTYYNLSIAFTEAGSVPIANVQQSAEQMMYLKPGLNLHHSVAQASIPVASDPAIAIERADIELAAIDETIDLPVQLMDGQLNKNSSNILMSVFYP
ncbi:hypothetical protein ACG93R_03615 [Acinetobacter guillouiae]|uniref:hypothetical protein n=1 Tax=Acinetobacter guillouiae TaxID=106649 RepID=UPI003AF65DD2